MLTSHRPTARPKIKRVSAFLQEAVSKDRELTKGAGRILVFAANVAAANSVAELLAEAGLQPLVYHREVALEQRLAVLEDMRNRYRHIGLSALYSRVKLIVKAFALGRTEAGTVKPCLRRII